MSKVIPLAHPPDTSKLQDGSTPNKDVAFAAYCVYREAYCAYLGDVAARHFDENGKLKQGDQYIGSFAEGLLEARNENALMSFEEWLTLWEKAR